MNLSKPQTSQEKTLGTAHMECTIPHFVVTSLLTFSNDFSLLLLLVILHRHTEPLFSHPAGKQFKQIENSLGKAYFDLLIDPVQIKVSNATGVAFHTFLSLLRSFSAAGAPGGPQQIHLLPGTSRILAR